MQKNPQWTKKSYFANISISSKIMIQRLEKCQANFLKKQLI